MPGAHNVLNCLATIAVADELEVPLDVMKQALATFGGVSRRFTVVGTPRDVTGATEIFKKACEGESKEACVFLGMGYLTGQGVPQDMNRAVAWFREACDAAPPAGCVQLAEL